MGTDYTPPFTTCLHPVHDQFSQTEPVEWSVDAYCIPYYTTHTPITQHILLNMNSVPYFTAPNIDTNHISYDSPSLMNQSVFFREHMRTEIGGAASPPLFLRMHIPGKIRSGLQDYDSLCRTRTHRASGGCFMWRCLYGEPFSRR